MRIMRMFTLASALILSLSALHCGAAENAAAGNPYPDYNVAPPKPESGGMQRDAQQLAKAMGVGWNVGNSLEAIGGETAWGNPVITPQLIALVKQSGFDTIRLPVAWDQYADQATGKIGDAWLAHVRDVVRMCVDGGLYVIVNIHWDGGWLENKLTADRQAAVGAKQRAYWQQIATSLRDFDEHLLFAGANEPGVEDGAGMAVLLAHHQTFVDAVRATGGRNAYRTLVVQGPKTDIEATDRLMTAMPRDTVPGRLMAEVHFYPYQFTLMTEEAPWGKPFYYWGSGLHSASDPAHNPTWGEEAFVERMFGLMKRRFVDRGIPVVLGEYGAIRRDTLTGEAGALHRKSRARFFEVVNRQARADGLVPVYWDAGNLGDRTMSLFDRRKLAVYDRQALDAVMAGAHGQ
jgi:endoglucanase